MQSERVFNTFGRDLHRKYTDTPERVGRTQIGKLGSQLGKPILRQKQTYPTDIWSCSGSTPLLICQTQKQRQAGEGAQYPVAQSAHVPVAQILVQQLFCIAKQNLQLGAGAARMFTFCVDAGRNGSHHSSQQKYNVYSNKHQDQSKRTNYLMLIFCSTGSALSAVHSSIDPSYSLASLLPIISELANQPRLAQWPLLQKDISLPVVGTLAAA